MAYSITKTITSILILQFVEQNLLRLDDPVSKHLSSNLLSRLPPHHYLKERGNDITIRMLLDHTSGVPNPMPLDWFFVEEDVSSFSSTLDEKRRDAFFKVLESSPTLKFTPGSNHLYSNVGYWILEMVIENVTGKSYVGVYMEQIALPLGLEDGANGGKITFEINEQQKCALATGHTCRYSMQTFIFRLLTPKKYWVAPNNSTKWSGHPTLIPHGLGYGGMYASVSGLKTILADLLKGLDLIFPNEGEEMHDTKKVRSGVLLSLESKKEMFGLSDNNSPLGWSEGSILVGGKQQHFFSKPGGGLGYHGNIRVYPHLGMASVFLCNGTGVDAGEINDRSDCLDTEHLEKNALAIR